MASPVADTYSAPSGATLYAGRTPDFGNVYIGLWGQSNAQGPALRSELADPPLSSDPGLVTFDAGTFDRVWIRGDATDFAKLQPSVNAGASNTSWFGPEFGLAVRWMRETTSGNLFIHKEATSGAPISSFDLSVWPGSDKLFRAVTGALPWIASHGYTLSARHWLWVQGENNSGDSQSSYQTALGNILTGLHTGGMLTTDSRSVLAQMKVGSSGYGVGPFDAKAALAAADPSHVSTIQMDYYQGDNLHCNARGMVQLGYDAFEKFFGAAHIAT